MRLEYNNNKHKQIKINNQFNPNFPHEFLHSTPASSTLYFNP